MRAKNTNESVALAKNALTILNSLLLKSNHQTPDALFQKLNKSKTLFNTTTQPIIKNAVESVMYGSVGHNMNNLRQTVTTKIHDSLDHVKNTNTQIAENGSNKIKKGMVVFTHGYSTAVLQLLLKAKKDGVQFEVHNTETRPNFFGRKMAEALAKKKIKVKHFTDLGSRQALKNADLILFGADTISNKGQIYSHIGSELIADLAEKYDVPVYVCMDSWKYAPSILPEYEAQVNTPSEIWQNAPKNVEVLNYGFEKIDPKLVTGVITELGIHTPATLISHIKEKYPWLKK